KEYDEMFKANRPMPPSAHISRNVICSAWQFRYFYDRRDELRKVMYKDGVRIDPSPEELSIILDSNHDIWMEWSAGKGSWLFEENYADARPENFVDVKWGDITVKADSKAVDYGHIPRDFYSIGLVYGERRRNPPLVRTAMTRDVKTGEVTLEIRNDGGLPAEGIVTLHPGEGSAVDTGAVPFKLAPREQFAVVVAHSDPNRDIMIEARSSLAGVRPSRAR
ncbi:MAG: hypothetical protein LBQ38_01160, partial [Spirochaetaceae bacterium]|nr:hypothetical protein [Spirochaetaceae bacterium]